MRDTYTNSIINIHYIWFYNVYKLCILIVNSFIHTKTCVTSFQKSDLVYRAKFTYTIGTTKYGNEEHGNLFNSYSHDLINILFK